MVILQLSFMFLMFFSMFLCFTYSLCGCVFQWHFIDLFSCIAACLFNKLTYLLITIILTIDCTNNAQQKTVWQFTVSTSSTNGWTVGCLSVERVRASVPVRRVDSHADVHVDPQVPVAGQPVQTQSQHALCRRHDGGYVASLVMIAAYVCLRAKYWWSDTSNY